jgi:integrase/recombinase XerD
LPEIIRRAGPQAEHRTIEFFMAEIRNPNTRAAYAHAVMLFMNWCDDKSLELVDITPFAVAAYIEELGRGYAAPTVKQHLAAIRMLFDYLVVGQVLPMNPASAVRGPKHVVRKGKTPVLQPEEARLLLDSIDVSTLSGLRDRALLGVMVFSFARVSAVVAMDVGDYYQQGKRWWLRLHEKGGKHHELPVHHKAEEYLDAYIEAAGIASEKNSPLWRSMTRERGFSDRRMSRVDVFRMIKRRVRDAELGDSANCHTFRATGITAYLLNGGTLERAQAIAAHESPRTTKLYDRTADDITVEDIERIGI